MAINEELYAFLVKNFGFRVKCQREKLGFTQADLARRIGVSKTTIQNYEAGNIPKGVSLFKLSRALRLSIDNLLIGEESPYIQEEWILENPSGMSEKELAEYHEKIKESQKLSVIDEDPEIARFLEQTREILKSRTSIAFSLMANIQTFHEAMHTKQQMRNLETRVAQLEEDRAETATKGARIRDGSPPVDKEDATKSGAM